jgi:phage terminase small subunit
MTDDPILSLSPKRRRFVEAYLQTWNASEAARQAGYKNDPNTAGPRLMANDGIKAAIAARMKQIAMKSDEVLLRLTQQASNEAAAYIRDDGTVDLARLISDGKSHLIKGTKWDRRGNLIVEFYDAQAALTLIGRAQRIFVEQVDLHQHMDQVSVNVYLPDNGRGGQVEQGSGDEAD